MCAGKCRFQKSLTWLCCSSLNETCLYGFFSTYIMFRKLHSDLSSVLIVRYLSYCAPFPRLNQSLQGDWFLSWLASELQMEEEDEVEGWRVQVEDVLLGLRKKEMPLEVDFFWGSSDCCCDLSCWLMMIWMSSWGKVGRKRKGAGSQRSRDSVWCLMLGKNSYKHSLSIIKLALYNHLTGSGLKTIFVTVHWCRVRFS